MKLFKIALLVTLPVFLMNQGSTNPNPSISNKPKDKVQLDSSHTLEKLLDAMIQVESRGNDSIIGDKHIVGGESAGALQIRPIMVKEVNRILKKQKSTKRYKLKDRFSRTKTVEMFMIWKNYHHKNSSNEKIARCWNGGPRGWKRKSTEYYWSKVQKELDI